MLRLKKKLGILFVASILLSSSKCSFREPPSTELCGALNDYGTMMFCTDPRVEPNEYERELLRGDICTNADDYGKLKVYCERLRTDLKKCERKRK